MLWLVFLGPFFFASYGLANYLAARRSQVPSIVFDWEHAIPFWAWTIVPYWIIDALYGISLFLCTTRRELDTHAKRLLTAQVAAVFCFVVFPHRFTFERPVADGAFGWLFDVLLGFDQPYNQLPSLHIALAVILWTLYVRKVRAGARIAVDVVFVLICGSVLTTYQHHFVDIPTGLLLGWLCVWLWPDDLAHRPRPTLHADDDPRRWRLALFYLGGAAFASLVALLVRGWAWWLLYPAASLVLVAANYAFLGAAGFQKGIDGRMSVASRWLLAPYLAAAWINSRWWTRGRAAPSLIGDGVFIGRLPSARELQASPFAAVVDLTAELPIRASGRTLALFPVLDLTTPTAPTLAAAGAAIERARNAGPVLVCCALGYSRSACAVAAWLLATGRAATVDDAFLRIRAARANVVLNAGHALALQSIAGAR